MPSYEITPIRLPSGRWVIRRETMADDCATILQTDYYHPPLDQQSKAYWTSNLHGNTLPHRPSVEFLQQLDEECNG